MTIFELGLTRSLQSATWDTDMRNYREIVETSEAVYEKLDSRTLIDTFLSLHKYMNYMLAGGGNNYKEPHFTKEKRRRAGEDIEGLSCSKRNTTLHSRS